METKANILKVLRRVIRRLPAYVVELRGQPEVDLDGSEVVIVDVAIADAAFDEMLARHQSHAIGMRIRDAFRRAKVRDWAHTRFCTATELIEILADDERDLPPQARPVRVRRRRVRAKKAGAARRPRPRATKRKAG